MNKKREIGTILIGIVAALIILVGQVSYYSIQMDAVAQQNIEESAATSDDTGNQEELRIFSNDAVSTFVQFHFNQILHFITNIYSEALEQVWVHVEERVTPIVYFETLFQRIISPNAP